MIFYIFFLFPVSDLKHLVKICCRLYTKNKKGEGQMKFKNYILKKVEKLTRKEVEKMANTACPAFNYQPKEPKQIKKLRKF